ncbi:Uncharacterised protein [Vibrio cholerae]|nr:Uncharacterised protein [Vibrio cholerae]
MAENHAQTCITSTEVTLLRTESGSKFDVRGSITRGDVGKKLNQTFLLMLG